MSANSLLVSRAFQSSDRKRGIDVFEPQALGLILQMLASWHNLESEIWGSVALFLIEDGLVDLVGSEKFPLDLFGIY